MEGKKMVRVSFSLEEQYKELLQLIVKRTRRTMTEEMRIAIDERARQLGLEPVAQEPQT